MMWPENRLATTAESVLLEGILRYTPHCKMTKEVVVTNKQKTKSIPDDRQ